MILARRGLMCLASVFATLSVTRTPAAEPVTIHLRSDADGSHVGFDPIGLLIQPGLTVRFVCEANYHTTAAYHPANASHSLRIPTTAKPWSSDALQPGDHFEITLTLPGVYDYFCVPQDEPATGLPHGSSVRSTEPGAR
jgi:plastocyanin